MVRTPAVTVTAFGFPMSRTENHRARSLASDLQGLRALGWELPLPSVCKGQQARRERPLPTLPTCEFVIMLASVDSRPGISTSWKGVLHYSTSKASGP